MMPPVDTIRDRGFRLADEGCFTSGGGDSITVHRERHISVERLPPWRTISENAARIYQTSDDRGAFKGGPQLQVNFVHMDRDDWEAFKRATDRAFDEFERRWPAEPKAEAT